MQMTRARAASRVTTIEQAAEILVGVAFEQPFIDANRRTAFAMTRGFLASERVEFTPPEREVEPMMDQVKAGRKNAGAAAAWISLYSRQPQA